MAKNMSQNPEVTKKSPAKMIAIIVGIIVVLLAAWMLIQPLFIKKEAKNTDSITYVNYQDPETGATLQYPSSWSKIESQPGAVNFAEKSGANVAFVIEDLSANPMTLQEYTEASLESLKSLDIGFQLTKSYSSTTAGYPSYTIEYTAENGSLKAQATGVWFITGNKAYILTYTAPVDEYEANMTSAKKIIDSIKVK